MLHSLGRNCKGLRRLWPFDHGALTLRPVAAWFTPDRASRRHKAIGDAGINLGFLVAQVVGRRYSAVVGFENEADANNAAALIKKATAARKK